MVSVFDIFKIGIGPSSSHTVGPMKAANYFVDYLEAENVFEDIDSIVCHFYGSLAYTGIGHGTDKAVILGLLGEVPEEIDVDASSSKIQRCNEDKKLTIRGSKSIDFDPQKCIKFHRKGSLPAHSNGMIFNAILPNGQTIEKEYYSIGGGFVLTGKEIKNVEKNETIAKSLPFPYSTGYELLTHCEREGRSVASIVLANELSLRTKCEIEEGISHLWGVMQTSIERGCLTEGVLPGRLNVKRRAPGLFNKLSHDSTNDPLIVMDWVNLYALAVNEENAAGGRVVTAPTNGAAGVVPAVLAYYDKFVKPIEMRFLLDFFLTATAVGSLYKMNASISGAEVGCQGEVGVACSMAAAGLAAVMDGNPKVVENAAEIGMEHNLGLTCDPVGGYVQVPCIERNAMGATKAINAARLALRGTGEHKVSLDKVIQTMQQTGRDMKSKYKETSKGGLAVNVVEC